MNGEQRLSPDTKIKVPAGCVDYLYDEVKRNQDEIRFLRAENNVMHNFFNLVNRIGGGQLTGMGCTDSMWQVKRDIEAAKAEAIRNMPQPMPRQPADTLNTLAKDCRTTSSGSDCQAPEKKELANQAASTN